MNNHKLSTLFHFQKSVKEENIPTYMEETYVLKKEYSRILFISVCLGITALVALSLSVMMHWRDFSTEKNGLLKVEKNELLKAEKDSAYNVFLNDHKGRMIYKAYNKATAEEQEKCDWILLKKK